MSDASPSTRALSEMRAAFDESFAHPPRGQDTKAAQLLAIRVAHTVCAIRVSEVAELIHARKIVAVPSPVTELLGVVGLRGSIVPVYSLAALLGHPQGAGASIWLALGAGKNPVAFAFSDFEGYRQVFEAQILSATGPMASLHVKEMVSADTEMRALIDIPALVKTIDALCGNARRPEAKEPS
jgi:purine-binding chemotaxis protein CheW